MTRSRRIAWYGVFVVVIGVALAGWALSRESVSSADEDAARVACTQDIQEAAGDDRTVVTDLVRVRDDGAYEFSGSVAVGDGEWTCVARATSGGWAATTSEG